MRTVTWLFLLAPLVVGIAAVDADGCWRGGGFCYCPPCWYPCCPFPSEPCCPPDTTPLDPLPPHPQPVTNGTTLYLQDRTYSEAFAIIWLRYPDGIYRVYRKQMIPAGTAAAANGPFYQGDHLIIETWARGTPQDWWHCRCRQLIVLVGLESTFDVIHCHYYAGPPHKQQASDGARPARIVVTLPADAKLTFDDRATRSTSEKRIFATPELAPGKNYTYTVRAEIVRDGQIHSMAQQITVRAGEETQVNMNTSEFIAAAN
jgi:uncharacterized protein (TIGR03000 family)